MEKKRNYPYIIIYLGDRFGGRKVIANVNKIWVLMSHIIFLLSFDLYAGGRLAFGWSKFSVDEGKVKQLYK